MIGPSGEPPLLRPKLRGHGRNLRHMPGTWAAFTGATRQVGAWPADPVGASTLCPCQPRGEPQGDGEGQVARRQRGLMILKWTVRVGPAFFALLMADCLMWATGTRRSRAG